MNDVLEFDKLKAEIKSAGVDTLRADNDNYFEAVIKSSSLGSVVNILERVFGPPAWPNPRDKLSKEANIIIKNAGGLRKGQTMYFLNEDPHPIFAMLWPWQAAEKVTIKIGRA